MASNLLATGDCHASLAMTLITGAIMKLSITRAQTYRGLPQNKFEYTLHAKLE
jgi:hypothetical protein